MSEWQERTHTQTFTEELTHAYDYDHNSLKELIEDKAKRLERSINGVVVVEQQRGSRHIEMKVIHGRSAEPEIIRRQLESARAEIMAEMHPDSSGMWEGPNDE